jgi:hypothetical protein
VTPYERLVAERLQVEAASIPLPPRERWTPQERRHGTMVPAIAMIAVLVAVATVAALGSTAADVTGRALATLRVLVRPQTQAVPPSWNVFVSEGLLLAVPPEFGVARPMARVPIFGGPGAPTLLRQVDFDRGLAVLVWKGTVRTLLDDFWLRGQQAYTRRPLNGPLSGEEIVTTSVGQSDPVGGRPSGTDQARSLFIQLAPDEIAHLYLGPTSSAAPETATTISAADRALQDQIGAYVRAAPDVDRNLGRAEAETIVRRVVGQLQNTALPPGDPNLVKIFSGEQWVYNWSNNSKSFAYIVIYPDRATRERDMGERIVDWVSPVTQRGVGNVLVLVGSDDANLRYQLIAALDELAK